MASGLFGSFALDGLAGLPPIETPIAPARPNLPQGNINLGGIQGTVVGQVPSSSVQQPSGSTPPIIAPPTNESVWQQAGDWLKNAGTALGKVFGPGTDFGVGSGSSSDSSSSSSSTAGNWITNALLTNRLVSAVIGLILIAAGLFLFQQTREILVGAGKTAAKLAA